MEAQREFAEKLLRSTCDQFPMSYIPSLEWRRMPVTAGLAIYARRTIALSSILMIDEDRIRVTLLHEYAHLLAVHRAGRKGVGHGAAWKTAMIDLGLEPKIRHQYEVKRNLVRQEVVYRCKKCNCEIVRKRKLPARRRYFHVRCGGPIVFLAAREVTAGKNEA